MNAPTAPSSPQGGNDIKPSHFLRQIIAQDLALGRYASRRWAGEPGDAAQHAQAAPDPAPIRTRFPPEPNGHLHIGHAKSICLNFGLAQEYLGVCHLRFDDTNPEQEDPVFVQGIIDSVRWLGFDWSQIGQPADRALPYHASDYFDFMNRAAEALIAAGHAYVDEQSAAEIRAHRGDFVTPGTNSPFRERSREENMNLWQAMKDGRFPDGAMVLRAKIDMASSNLNLRDPTIYRIRHARHHRTGDRWCVYPMYTFAHPIEDALEQITHSFCTLEFEDQRPFYDWLLERLIELGLLAEPAPRQYEFARLNLTFVVTSKRKLAQLVSEAHVKAWDDPRLPTLLGLRRRGYTPSSLRLFCERIGVSKSDSWIDYSVLEGCLREDLEQQAPRGMAVLNPVKLVLLNWAEVFGGLDHTENCSLPALPATAQSHESAGVNSRALKLGHQVWIDREDFEETPPKGYKRLSPGQVVRLKGGYAIECLGCRRDEQAQVQEVHARLIPDTKSGTPGADNVKARAVITWVGLVDAVAAEIRLYDRLFSEAHPDAGGKDFLQSLNPNSLKVVTGFIEPSLALAQPEQQFQFERHGYFVADRFDHTRQRPVFNRIVSLKDNWAK